MPAWLPKLLLGLAVISCIGMIVMAVLASKAKNSDNQKKYRGLVAGAVVTGILGAVALVFAVKSWNSQVEEVGEKTNIGEEAATVSAEKIQGAETAVGGLESQRAELIKGLATGDKSPDEIVEAAKESVTQAQAAAATAEAGKGAALQEETVATTTANANKNKAIQAALGAQKARVNANAAAAAAAEAEKTAETLTNKSQTSSANALKAHQAAANKTARAAAIEEAAKGAEAKSERLVKAAALAKAI